MKNILLVCILLLGSFALFTSCGGDDDSESCKTCELIVAGATSTEEICPGADGIIVTTTTVAGTSIDTVSTLNVSQYVTAAELAGATCN